MNETEIKYYEAGMLFSRTNGDICFVMRHKDGLYDLVMIHNYAYDNRSVEQTDRYSSLEDLFTNEHQEGEMEMDGEVVQIDK